MKETIKFKQQRELGTIITDTFKFIRNEWKPLLGLIFKITGPALLVLIAAYVYYIQSFSSGFLQMDDLDSAQTLPPMAMLAMLLLLLAAVVYYSLLNGVVLHYIKSYINNQGVAEPEEVAEGVRNDFWKLTGTSLVIGILTAVGTMLCVIPGIYVGVVLSTIYAVVIFERKEIIDAVKHCFTLIKNEWWTTFATLIVIFILYYFMVMIVQIPQYIYFFIKGFSMMEIISTDPTALFDWGYILLTSIGLIFQYLLHAIVVLCVSFIYFHLHEKKYFTGTMEEIDSIGSL